MSDLSDNKEETIAELNDNDAVMVEKFAYPTIKPINVEREQFLKILRLWLIEVSLQLKMSYMA